jgi:hypothetical protein
MRPPPPTHTPHAHTRPTNHVSFSCEQILVGAIKEQCEFYFGPRHRMNVKGFQHFETLMDEEGYDKDSLYLQQVYSV